MVLVVAATAGIAFAAPRVPSNDDEIVETLPLVAGWSRNERGLRQALARSPRDERVAIAAARAYLELARAQGDARYAGYAMGALAAWEPAAAATTPPDVLVMRATVAQFLHDFDGAEASLKSALARQPSHAQAWITLATILRVRGRYAESDDACRALGRAGPALYASACLAENAGLRGDHRAARDALQTLLRQPQLQDAGQGATRQWLLTTVAEVEELAGRPAAAEAAYREALGIERTGYDVLAYSDFLISQNRAGEVPALLKAEARSDAVLLRLAIAAERQVRRPSTSPSAASSVSKPDASARRDADELQARFQASAERPGAAALHAREQAMFALDVQGDAARALALARLNVQLQREPVDLLVLARAAAAANDDAARREVKALMQQIGLRDARIAALL